jgi:hypothetical protein
MILKKRVDRLERLFTLALMTGKRWRSKFREQSEKIDMTIDAQIRLEETMSSIKADHDTKLADLGSFRQKTESQLDELRRRVAKNHE